MGRIFVRERGNVGEGDGRPRYAVVGVEGTDIRFFQMHLRKGELDKIVQTTGAELIVLPRGHGEHAGQEGGGGKRKHGRKHRGNHGQGGDAASA